MQLRTTALTASLLIALAGLSACSSTATLEPASNERAAIRNDATAQAAAPAVTQTAAAQAAAAAYDFELDVFHPVIAKNGMVASEQELATQIGVDILKAGGNAVDAAVAVGFALAVALPNAGNIGGGGFMMVHDARSGKDIALDFREVAPKGASRNMYLDAGGKVIDGKSLYTHYAVGVPGTVAGMTHALSRWGSMPLARVMAPAIALADKGYPVSVTLAKTLDQEKKNMGRWPATQAVFWRNGAPLQSGERLVQKDLAQSLRLISQQGAKAFYEGAIAQKIVTEMAPHANALSLQDLRDYKVAEREPVRGSYRGYQIVTMPPPSSGGAHLIQILNMMERWPMNQWGADSAQSVHYMTEAMKLAYADRSEYLGDPDFVKIPLKGLISKGYASELAASIKPQQARPAKDIRPGRPQPYESDQTTHYSVVDKAGNAVAVTYTLNTNFGSGIVARGTGILLNNEMDDFSAKPGVANAYGLVGGDANAVQAGKRPLSSMTPTLVLKDGKPVLVTGSPGGARIITTVLQQVVNHIDFGMNPAEAAATPRFHHQWTPDELRVEKGFSPDTLALLRQWGHKVALKASMGRTQTIEIRDGLLRGASDPRNPDGKTMGY
ncbi:MULTISPECIES: gamma-glutamyltransferase [Comamonas]|uniref:gamma-glutamyltransferase n=1 Tax=Comamonas TaxID=283 RepID=UPI00050EAF22|nr:MULTISPECIES: gamma-glutamyltransferase [Comamonas]KGG93957.1 gamma-glutamyltranspeptidase [Comamonas thiooxydans]KGG99921.1 gamma-glutamyltranspeptidase [Comamonas thiooxydans]KGH06315.1 gamma-glutamyltranspeptidase [Comamonas thiooxydans]KGH14719.1 gamma-glutamyltranspeptidase [Comamonas thiooxydans]TZG08450.1 gamma-glutamyltransferase [Comamonas thiooxydans]